MDIALGTLTKEEMEITELSSRKIEASLQVKQVVLKVLDVLVLHLRLYRQHLVLKD